MREYYCRWCNHTKLKPAEFVWHDYIMVATSIVPYYCPHCFARYYRPHQRTKDVFSILRDWMASQVAVARLYVTGSAALIGGGLIILAGTLASGRLSTSALLMVTLFGNLLFLTGLICLALNFALFRLARLESQIEYMRQLLETEFADRRSAHDEDAENAKPPAFH